MTSRAVFIATTVAAMGAAGAVASCGPQHWSFETTDSAAAVIGDAATMTARDGPASSDSVPADSTAVDDRATEDPTLVDVFPFFDGFPPDDGGEPCAARRCPQCPTAACADGSTCVFGVRCAPTCMRSAECSALPFAHLCNNMVNGMGSSTGACVECLTAEDCGDAGAICDQGLCDRRLRDR